MQELNELWGRGETNKIKAGSEKIPKDQSFSVTLHDWLIITGRSTQFMKATSAYKSYVFPPHPLLENDV